MALFDHIFEELERNGYLIPELLSGISDEQASWKPNPRSWSLLEVICHLIDEEKMDFRFRTSFILKTPNTIPPSIDPAAWVQLHHYAVQDFTQKIGEFSKERSKSIDWLRRLNDPDWNLFFDHPKLGRMTAGYYLSNWLAHDFLHIRQIIRLKFEYLEYRSGGNLNYAGTW